VEDGDLEPFFEWQADAESAHMAAFPARTRGAFDAHWARIRADPAATVLTVVADGEVAGNVGSWTADGRRFVGYWIGKPFWGQGIASEALAQFTLVERVRPLHAVVVEHNVGSRRVLEKTGFRAAGRERVLDAPGAAPLTELHFVLEA
jgi:RimJ/RimL family protein N-acetyltransferase